MKYFSSVTLVVLAAMITLTGFATIAQGEMVFANRRNQSRPYGGGPFVAWMNAYDTATGNDVAPSGFSTSYTAGDVVEGLAYNDGCLYASGGSTSGTKGRIRIFDTTTGLQTGYYTASANDKARGLVFDSAGNLYCGLKDNGGIVKISPGGTEVDASWGTAAFSGVSDLEIYGDKLYVGTENANFSGVWVYDLDTGGAPTLLNGTGGTVVDGIAFTPDGTLYTVSFKLNEGLKKWGCASGTYYIDSTVPMDFLKDVDYIDGDLYISAETTIEKYDLATLTLTTWQSEPAGSRPGYLVAVPVPEPGAIALLATGLIGLLAYAWKRKRK